MQVSIGIDIGGTNSPFGIVSENGQILKQGAVKTTSFANPEIFAKNISDQIKGQLSELGEKYELSGIGIGAPNGNYYNGTIEYAPNLKWKGIIDLVGIFKKHFDVPVTVTNDANAAAIGEYYFGKGQGIQNFILVTLGTGIGSGFFSNGKLIHGADGFAGELGHTIIEENGRDCACGRKGCLETYASVNGMLRTANIILAESYAKSELRDVPSETLTAKIICDAAKEGDEISLQIVDYTARKLAFSMANAVAITSPQKIILFGGLAKAGTVLLNPTRVYFEEYLHNLYKGNVQIEISALTEQNAAILGASALIWNNKEIDQNENVFIS